MDKNSIDKQFYSKHITNIDHCDIELNNMNISSLETAIEHLDNILKNNKHKEIEDIRDFLKIAIMSIEKAQTKINNIMENRD
jgi:hypothetical protein